MNKYGNRKVATIDGEVFDSQREATRYQELRLLERAGAIKDLKRQVPFELIPAQREAVAIGKRGKLIQGKVIEKAATYIADFVYTDSTTGETVVEDTKGFRTKDYILKRKMLLYIHGIRIREV
jgi:hypothetical protein